MYSSSVAVCSFELLFQWALISHQILYLDMGTQNLLPFLSKYARKVSLNGLRGKVCGIDEFGITPNMKLAEENRRRESRAKSRENALRSMNEGNIRRGAALIKRAISIHHKSLISLVKVCIEKGYDYVV